MFKLKLNISCQSMPVKRKAIEDKTKMSETLGKISDNDKRESSSTTLESSKDKDSRDER